MPKEDRKGPTASGRLALAAVLVLTLSMLGVIYALVMSMR